MQQTIIDGNCLFYRDISVKEYARYVITPPQNKKLILPENWLVMDKESQIASPENLSIEMRHSCYGYNYLKNSGIDPIIFKVIEQEQENDFSINNYYTDETQSEVKFDGSAHSLGYSWILGRNNYSFFSSELYITESTMQELQNPFSGTEVQYSALALKYPYMAYCLQLTSGENELIVHLRTDSMNTHKAKSTITSSIKKLSWLHGKNLLGLTEQGDIVTIDADSFSIYPQHFSDKRFIDIAVDMKHPWRFIALTEEYSIIYGDFSSYYAVFKEESGFVSKIYNYVAAILDNAQISDSKSVLLRSKNTYKTIKQLERVPESHIYKIWFHNDKIGVYLGENGNINGSFDIFKLQDRIFMLNMNKVDSSDSECLERTAVQLDCHT